MNFDFSDDQQEIKRTARDLLASRSSFAAVRAAAESGVDFISVGALTHSAPVLDFSLLLSAD
jgi:nicotinate-nucleotide pyrophosphorylase